MSEELQELEDLELCVWEMLVEGVLTPAEAEEVVEQIYFFRSVLQAVEAV